MARKVARMAAGSRAVRADRPGRNDEAERSAGSTGRVWADSIAAFHRLGSSPPRASDSFMSIRWPDRFDPRVAPVHVRNDLAMSAPAEVVWTWLIRASAWPTWYPNAQAVQIGDGAARDLSAGVEFRWRTFGIPLVSRVGEFVPAERIGWYAQGLGVDVYHAWYLEPRGSGCWVLTEETQYGFMARLGHLAMPRRMGKWHQIWLENMAARAATGPPP